MRRARTDEPRARIVCDRCHNRKVRCNLQDQPQGRCENCRRDNEQCRPWTGKRRRTGHSESTKGVSIATTPQPRLASVIQVPSRSTHDVQPRSNGPTFPKDIADISSGYLGDGSLMACPADARLPYTSTVGILASEVTDRILDVTGANLDPSESLLHASLDLYFLYLFPLLPIFDRRDLDQSEPKTLIRQAIHFSGCLMRHDRLPGSKSVLEDTYRRIKTLLFLNVESNKFVILKCLCILGCWGSNSPEIVALDCPWHWAGAAVRLALQMGLHREAIHAKDNEARSTRRVWWSLHNIETLQAAIYGRPTMLRRGDFDVSLPSFADCDSHDICAQTFISWNSLCLIAGNIHGLSIRGGSCVTTEIAEILASLHSWLKALPEPLRLYTGDRRNSYNLHTIQSHLMYLVLIVWLYLLPGEHRRCIELSAMSFVASACIARLYEEILHHEDTHHLLPIHNWMIMVAAIPQVYSRGQFSGQDSVDIEEWDIFASVVSQMAEKYPSSRMALRRINHFRQDANTLPITIPHNTDSNSIMHQDESPVLVAAYTNDITALIPYPESVSPRLALLLRFQTVLPGAVDARLMRDFPYWDTDWTLDWSAFYLDHA